MDTSKQLKDTCQLQNTIDYALDGSGQAITTTDPPTVRKSLMLTPLEAADEFKLQRQDPLHKTLTDEKAKATNSSTAIIGSDLQTFVREYCKINTTFPATWGKPVNATYWPMTNQVFFDDLIDRTKYVEPHNKMLPPTLCTGDKAPAVCAEELTHHPRAQLSLAGYHAYVDKYAKALQLCAASGVPKYTLWNEGKMFTDRVYTVGQNFLLFAAVWAFAWCYTVAHIIAQNKDVYADVPSDVGIANEAEIQFKDLVKWERRWYNIFHYVFLFMCVLAWIWLLITNFIHGRSRRVGLSPAHAPKEDDQYLKTQFTSETDLTLQFFKLFWCLVNFILIFGVLFFWQQWYNQTHDEASKSETENLTHEVEHLIAGKKPEEYEKWEQEVGDVNPYQPQLLRYPKMDKQFTGSSTYHVGFGAQPVMEGGKRG
jgi:hypothetical protein